MLKDVLFSEKAKLTTMLSNGAIILILMSFFLIISVFAFFCIDYWNKDCHLDSKSSVSNEADPGSQCYDWECDEYTISNELGLQMN
jgi:hypothetical protein